MQLIRPFEKAWPMTQNFATKVTYMRSGIHSGIDWACPSGTDLFAVFDGEIIQRDDFTLTGYGRAIYLRSIENPRFVALYGHCSKLIAPVGAKVKAGTIIALSGKTGLVFSIKGDGSHLHFGLKKDGSWIDPLPMMEGYGLPLTYHDAKPPVKVPVTEETDEPTKVKESLPGVGVPGVYIVVAGDSLYKIAAKMLGSGKRWREIFDLNKSKIKDPKKIYPGQALAIPVEK